MTFCAPAAPLESISGTTPKMNANAVIKMGRKRRRADSRAASWMGMPPSCFALANSTIRMAFLAARPINMIRPTCT